MCFGERFVCCVSVGCVLRFCCLLLVGVLCNVCRWRLCCLMFFLLVDGWLRASCWCDVCCVSVCAVVGSHLSFVVWLCIVRCLVACAPCCVWFVLCWLFVLLCVDWCLRVVVCWLLVVVRCFAMCCLLLVGCCLLLVGWLCVGRLCVAI